MAVRKSQKALRLIRDELKLQRGILEENNEILKGVQVALVEWLTQKERDQQARDEAFAKLKERIRKLETARAT